MFAMEEQIRRQSQGTLTLSDVINNDMQEKVIRIHGDRSSLWKIRCQASQSNVKQKGGENSPSGRTDATNFRMPTFRCEQRFFLVSRKKTKLLSLLRIFKSFSSLINASGRTAINVPVESRAKVRVDLSFPKPVNTSVKTEVTESKEDLFFLNPN